MRFFYNLEAFIFYMYISYSSSKVSLYLSDKHSLHFKKGKQTLKNLTEKQIGLPRRDI